MQGCCSLAAFLRAVHPPANVFRYSRNLKQKSISQTDHVRTIRSIARPVYTVSSRRRRRTAARSSSTSFALVDALRVAGHDFSVPNPLANHQVDLSEVAAGTYYGSYLRRKNRHGRTTQTEDAEHREDVVSYQTIIAEYIGRASAISDESRAFLRAREYTAQNVKQWADILCERLPEVAARRMLAYQRHEEGGRQLPVPVLLFFLRRQRLDASALRVCILLAWQEVERIKKTFSTRASNGMRRWNRIPEKQIPINQQTFFILIVRLLRHARIIWPGALITITNMFTDYHSFLFEKSQRKPKVRSNPSNRLSRLHNQVLALLALPVSHNPYYAVLTQQRAQFDLLKSMTQYDPPLNISRQGYRSIISVQLANKKTDQERDWDNLKARSWPPWKQDKTGLDTDKGREYGTSRAMHVLNRAREAGYGFAEWENIASTLAGWNVDGSPTIQTRSFLNVESSVALGKRTVHDGAAQEPSSPKIWAARIQATRTMHEAWATFLDYKEEKLPSNIDVYVAMLAKIASEDKRQLRERRPPDTRNPSPAVPEAPLNAGDSLEVSAPPISYKEAPFLSIPPPTFHELTMEMFSHGWVVRGEPLVLLLANAKSIAEGTDYLLRSVGVKRDNYRGLSKSYIEGLLLDPATSEEIFTGFVGLLCRFPFLSHDKSIESSSQTEYLLTPLLREPPILFVLRLLRLRKPKSRTPWYKLLEAARQRRVHVDLKRRYQTSHPEYSDHWSFVRTILDEMPASGMAPDAIIFRNVCSALEPDIVQAQDVLAAQTHSHLPTGPAAMSFHDAAKLLGETPHFLQSMFNDVMGVGSKKGQADIVKAAEQHKLPRLLATPRPDMLHAYVRILGALQDWQGIFNFIDWMVKYEKEVNAASEAGRGSTRLRRRTLVAARVYLQRCWEKEPQESKIAPERTVRNVRNLIEQVPAWGGWPSTREVFDYCNGGSGQFPGVTMRTSDDNDRHV